MIEVREHGALEIEPLRNGLDHEVGIPDARREVGRGTDAFQHGRPLLGGERPHGAATVEFLLKPPTQAA